MALHTTWRRLVLVGTPLTLTILLLFDPQASSADVASTLFPVADWWLTLHILQLPLFGLMGLAIYLLIEDVPGPAAILGRVAAPVFAVFYGAGDAIAGISTGILARAAVGLPPDQQTALVTAITTLFRDPAKNLVFDVGTYAGVVALIAAAFALWRAGVPRLPVLLLVPAAFCLTQDHRPPYGPLAFGVFFVAVLWIELARRRAAPAPAEAVESAEVYAGARS